MSCAGGGRMKEKLAHIDSLTETDQHAAIACIDSLTSASGGSISRSVRMRLDLLRAKACNKLLLPLNRDSLLMLDGYFTDHGTSNERMLTKYIIGCSYLDDNDAPRALEYFHEAASMADTTNVDCDWRTLQKVHVQSGLLLYNKDALHDADEEYKLAFKYAIKAKDTLNALLAIEQKTNIYMAEDKTDSLIKLRKKLYSLYMKNGYTENAAMSLGPIVVDLVKMGELDEAKRYLDNYERNSGLFDSLGNIEKGREIHYYIKGTYYLEAGKPDSAEYFFRKCASSTTELAVIQPAFKGLMRLYKQLNLPDSMAKYAELVNVLQDTVYNKDMMQHLQQMQAVYNYDRHVEMAEKESAYIKALGTAVALILLLVIIYMVGYIIRKRKLRLREKHKLEQSIGELQNANHGLEAMNESQRKETRQIIDEKTKEIEQLRQEKQNLEKQFDCQPKQPLFADEPIVRLLDENLRKAPNSMTSDEYHRLKELFTGFEPLSRWEKMMSSNEYQVCLLVKVGFSPKDISILMGLSLSNISNIRKRLFEKMTGRKGSAKDFDKFIMSL